MKFTEVIWVSPYTSRKVVRRPDLGRVFDAESVAAIRAEGTPGTTVQIVVDDGLPARAVGTRAPKFVEKFTSLSETKGWAVGRTLAVRHARVGLMNQVGELLQPEVVLLLIGERPGLDIQASMSAYLGYRPDRTHTDADRSLISNIHDAGIQPEHAAEEAVALIERLRASDGSGGSPLLSEYQRNRLSPARQRQQQHLPPDSGDRRVGKPCNRPGRWLRRRAGRL